jgi:alkaline phosphatase D
MKFSIRYLLIVFIVFSSCKNHQDDFYVLLISFDGFRADYLDWYDTPNMDRFVKKGVRAKGLIPVFVSKTFPNHYSIATGMYAENHGLIGNHFYDAKFDETYSLSDRSKVKDSKFYGGEPIWVTAEKQGLKTASYFWVGTEAPIGGIYSSKWKEYEHDFPFESRIDSIVSWFSLPLKERPRFCSLYFHEPDWVGHEMGPRSSETGRMVSKLDSLFGDLINKLSELSIYNQLNIIAVADHGMAEISSDRTVNLSEYADMGQVIQEGSGPYAFLYSQKIGIIDSAVGQLQKAEHISVYLKSDIPERFHFKNHHRIKDALVIADEGWYIQNQAISSSSTAGEYIPTGGTHGYDNQLKSMHALFIAQGPAFKNNIVTEPFENVNIYPMIAHILGIDPSKKIDGNLNNIKHLLK